MRERREREEAAKRERAKADSLWKNVTRPDILRQWARLLLRDSLYNTAKPVTKRCVHGAKCKLSDIACAECHRQVEVANTVINHHSPTR